MSKTIKILFLSDILSNSRLKSRILFKNLIYQRGCGISFKNRIFEKNPPASEEEIKRIKKQLGLELPEVRLIGFVQRDQQGVHIDFAFLYGPFIGI